MHGARVKQTVYMEGSSGNKFGVKHPVRQKAILVK